MSEEKKGIPHYGTFQGVINFPPPTAITFPHYGRGYQAVPGYAVAEGTPVRENRLPCCGIGFSWFLFIIGFFLAAIPWYIAAIFLLCTRTDPREKPGYVACTIAAVLAAFTTIFGLTRIGN